MPYLISSYCDCFRPSKPAKGGEVVLLHYVSAVRKGIQNPAGCLRQNLNFRIWKLTRILHSLQASLERMAALILAASRFYYSRRGSAKKISRIFSDFPRAKNKYGVSKRVRAGGYWETAAWDLQRVLAEIFDRPKKCQKLKI